MPSHHGVKTAFPMATTLPLEWGMMGIEKLRWMGGKLGSEVDRLTQAMWCAPVGAHWDRR